MISFPIERSLSNYTGSALINGRGGKRMSFISLFCNVLLKVLLVLVCRAGPAFSSETVKYLMSVFVRGPTFHIISSHALIYAGSGWQRRNRASGSESVRSLTTKVNSPTTPSSSLCGFMLRYGVTYGDILSLPIPIVEMARDVRILRL